MRAPNDGTLSVRDLDIASGFTTISARGAVIVVCSDGWERGGTELLAEQMTRLRRLAHAVVWVNPHKGRVGYEPLTGGMQAALPSVDHFVSGHSMAAFEELTGVIQRA